MVSPTEPNSTLVSKVFREAVLKVVSTSTQPVEVSPPVVTTTEIPVSSSVNKFGQKVLVKYRSEIKYNVSFVSISKLDGIIIATSVKRNLTKSDSSGKLLSIVQSIALNNYSMNSFLNVTLEPIQLSDIKTKLEHTESLSSASTTPTSNINIIIPVVVVVSVLLMCIALYLYNQKQNREDVLIVGEDLLDFGRDYQGTMADVIHSVSDSEVVRQSIDGLDARDVRSSINPLALNRQDNGSSRLSFFNNVISSVSQYASGAIRQPIARLYNSSSSKSLSGSSKKLQDPSNKISLGDSSPEKKKPSSSSPPSKKQKNLKLVDCTVQHIQTVLERLNLSKYRSLFVENNIDGRILSEITSIEDLQSCGIAMPPPVMRALLKEIIDYQKKGVPDL